LGLSLLQTFIVRISSKFQLFFVGLYVIVLLKIHADLHDISCQYLAIFGHLTFVIKNKHFLKAHLLYEMEKSNMAAGQNISDLMTISELLEVCSDAEIILNQRIL
jgi:hypothetical protein